MWWRSEEASGSVGAWCMSKGCGVGVRGQGMRVKGVECRSERDRGRSEGCGVGEEAG